MRIEDLPRKHSQQPVKIDLKIDMENFGPITKGSVALKPLTIFVGPNNSGKSYAAMLIHSILSSENNINSHDQLTHYVDSLIRSDKLFKKDLQKIVEKNKGKQSFIIPTSITEKIFHSIIQNEFSDSLESTISVNFGSPVSDLIRTKQRSTKISISDSNPFNVSINKKLSVKTGSNFDIKFKFEISQTKLDHFETEEKDGIVTVTISKEIAKDFFKYEIATFLVDLISRRIKHDFIPTNSYYFPAARSGILQGHKALSASIIKSASFDGIRSFQVPQLTGIMSDFISNIILIPSQPGPFFKLAEEFESELLHGNIKLSTHTKTGFPEITYRSSNKEIPLHQTSSMISEIASLSLYLKYIVHPSSMLIIEEPEAHLHPMNQLIFAKYVVKMIRAGLNVLITTHSVFLLEQLGKFMLASKIKPKMRKKLGYGDDYLLPDEVSPYVFVQNTDNDNCIVPIETNDEDGISQEEFVKVSELLYSESIKLQQNLPEN